MKDPNWTAKLLIVAPGMQTVYGTENRKRRLIAAVKSCLQYLYKCFKIRTGLISSDCNM